MRFKLDENFGGRTQGIFAATGHDVQTVRAESLQGASDQQLYAVCCTEKRCLVTLDLDFANVTRFPPENAGGIVGHPRATKPKSGLARETGATVPAGGCSNAC